MTTRAARRRSPAHTLLSTSHRRLLGLLLVRPEQGFHVREIARLTGLDAGSAHRGLKQLEQAGVVAATRSGNQVRYQAEKQSPIFRELQGIVLKTVGLADLLRDALTPLAKKIHEAFVFGSIARGEEGPRSDIDLMVVGNVGFDDVVVAVHPLQERLGREINSIVLTPAQYRTRMRDAGFVSRVAKGPRIALLGTNDES